MPIKPVKKSEAIDKFRLHALLKEWLSLTKDECIGHEVKPNKATQNSVIRQYIYIIENNNYFYLNSDATRESVRKYLELVSKYGTDLVWTSTLSSRGTETAVAFGPNKEIIKPKFYLYKEIRKIVSPKLVEIYPDEMSDQTYAEGATKQVLVNQYERKPKARADCISHHGCICYICNIDFAKVYGEIGKGFIHVHHIIEISSIGEGYKVNPKTDLIPLCPNCHAMIHTTKPAMTPEELKAIYRANQCLTS